jgi:hypothetical protein
MATAEARQQPEQQRQTDRRHRIADTLRVFLRDTLPRLRARRTRRDNRQETLFSRSQADAEQ